MTRRFRGPIQTLRAGRPTAGSTMSDIDDAYRVSRVEIIADKGGSGRMIVYLSTLITSAAGGGGNDTTHEVEWVNIEKPLIAAPYFRSGGGAALTQADHEAIETWQADRSTSNYSALSTNAKLYANRILAGIESFLLASPVARRTTRSSDKPSSSVCGRRQTPPNFPGLPSGYVWLKTADRAIKPGNDSPWERIEEWTGADLWDTNLYPAA